MGHQPSEILAKSGTPKIWQSQGMRGSEKKTHKSESAKRPDFSGGNLVNEMCGLTNGSVMTGLKKKKSERSKLPLVYK